MYETAGVRSSRWIKLKHTGFGEEGLRDTLDLIPIGAYFGKGNRTGFYGSYLMAAFNPANNTFESVCKVGTGFKQSDLSFLQNSVTHMEPSNPEMALR